jgi:hypothetical protein
MRNSHITSLQYVVNSKANDTLYDTDVKLYKGRDYILEEMEGLKFSINAKVFLPNQFRSSIRTIQNNNA